MRLPCAEFTIDHSYIFGIEVSISSGNVASASEVVRCKIMKTRSYQCAYLRLLASDFLSKLLEKNQSNRTTYCYSKKIYSTTETQEKNTVKIIVQQQQQEKEKKVHRTV